MLTTRTAYPTSNGEEQMAEQDSSSKGIVVKAVVLLGLLALGKVAAMGQRGVVGTEEMRLVGIVVAEILLLVMSLLNVDFVFYVLLFYLPFSVQMPGDYGTAVNITNVLITIVIFGIFCRSVKEGAHFFVKTELDGIIGLYMLLVFLSFFRASLTETLNVVLLITLVKRFCTPIFLYYLASWVVREREQVKQCMFVIMVTTLMVAVLATKDTTTPTHFSWQRREGGVVTQANILASFLTYYMFYFMSFCRMYTDNWRSWLLLLAIYPCGRGVMLTFSRGGYFAFVAGTLFMSYIWKKGLFVAVAIIMIIVWFNQERFLPNAVVERLNSTFVKSEKEEWATGKQKMQIAPDSRGRIDIWRGGIKMVMRNPILGVGYGQFPLLLPAYNPAPGMMDAHNAYLLIAAEMGLPTLFIFLMLTARLFKWSLQIYLASQDRLYAAIGMGYAGGMVAFWVSNFFGTRFTTTETISYFWILSAFLVLVRKIHAGCEVILEGNEKRAAQAPPPRRPGHEPWIDGLA